MAVVLNWVQWWGLEVVVLKGGSAFWVFGDGFGRLCFALCLILSVQVLFFVYDVLQWIGLLGGSYEKVLLILVSVLMFDRL